MALPERARRAMDAPLRRRPVRLVRDPLSLEGNTESRTRTSGDWVEIHGSIRSSFARGPLSDVAARLDPQPWPKARRPRRVNRGSLEDHENHDERCVSDRNGTWSISCLREGVRGGTGALSAKERIP